MNKKQTYNSKNKIKLDKFDYKILAFLDVAARTPLTVIAKNLKTSQARISYKINRLNQEKIILGSYALLDLGKLGYSYIRLLLRLENMNKNTENQILDYLKTKDCVGIIALYQGAFDLQISLFIKSFDFLYRFVHKFTLRFGNHILEKKIGVVNEFIKLPQNYLYNMPSDQKSILKYYGGDEKIDDIDKKILTELSKDARVSLVDIAQKINLSVNTVKKRKENLEKKGIINGYKAYLNFKKMGYQQQKVLLTLNSMDQKLFNRIRNYLMAQPNVISVNKIIADYDIEFEIDVHNHNELNSFIAELKTQFENNIKRVDVAVLLKEYFSGLTIFTENLFLNP